MNYLEVLEKLNAEIEEAEEKQKAAEEENDNLNTMYYIGKQNGLLWAKMIILNLDLKENESES